MRKVAVAGGVVPKGHQLGHIQILDVSSGTVQEKPCLTSYLKWECILEATVAISELITYTLFKGALVGAKSLSSSEKSPWLLARPKRTLMLL